MPIVGNSVQSQRSEKSLEEFYKGLASSENGIDKLVGNVMLSFIAMVNETFTDTVLYGLTSHYHLVIQRTDNWKDEWYITVYTYGDNKFQFEYKMPEAKSPWKYATIKGQADTIQDAKDYLIIAMTECEGWIGNEELNTHYNDLKQREAKIIEYSNLIVECAISFRKDANYLIEELGKAFNFSLSGSNEFPKSVYQYKYNNKGVLNNKWSFYFHGAECRFDNLENGQIVEFIHTTKPEFGFLDGHFLYNYINTTSKFKELAAFLNSGNKTWKAIELLADKGILKRDLTSQLSRNIIAI